MTTQSFNCGLLYHSFYGPRHILPPELIHVSLDDVMALSNSNLALLYYTIKHDNKMRAERILENCS